MFKSEAQAYQNWRRNIKKQLQFAQRQQTLYKWQVDYHEIHPRLQKLTWKPLPVSNPWDHWNKWCSKASQLQLVLNTWKVKR